MSEESPVARAFGDHDAFESRDGEYAVTSTPFDAVATATETASGWRFRVTVTVPTLPAVVEGDVGDPVVEGWFETFELRLADAYDLVRSDRTDPPTVERDRERGEVRATFGFAAEDPRRGVDDVAAVVDYVEGTYVQGVIPGYEYDDPVAGLVAAARRAGEGEGP